MSDIKRVNVNSNKATINPDYNAKLNRTDADIFTADTMKYIAGYNPENGINMQNAVDVLAKKQSKAAYVLDSDSDSYLDLTDESGFVLARFNNGHFQTLNFDSSVMSNIVDVMSNRIETLEEVSETHPYVIDNYETEESSLDISDEEGNVIARFANGHIQTKFFDSSLITMYDKTDVYDTSLSDLDISDEEGNIIVSFTNGGIKTKEFNSFSIKEENLSSGIINKLKDVDELKNKDYFKGITNAFSAKKNMENNSSDAALNNYSLLATIVHITDNHGDANRTERAFKVAELLDANIVCTGDIVMYNSTDDFSWMTNIVSNYPNVLYDLALGNHDMRSLNATTGYPKYIEPFYDNQGWNLPQGIINPLYYYRDDNIYKIRYISLCQWEGGSTPSISLNLIDFLKECLLSIPINYGVIILMHSPENKPVKDNEYSKFFSKKIYYSLSFSGVASIKTIVDAFISKTSIEQTWENVTINADFSNVASNEFIAYLCGHYHADGISFATNTTNRQVVLLETCTCAWVNMNTDGTSGTAYPKYTEYGDLARQIGSENEDAFNVYIIDRKNHLIKIVRIGSNIPYDMSIVRDFMSIEYIKN